MTGLQIAKSLPQLLAELVQLAPETAVDHLVTDLDAIDQFVSQTTSKFIVALLSVLGTAFVLLWMHCPRCETPGPLFNAIRDVYILTFTRNTKKASPPGMRGR